MQKSEQEHIRADQEGKRADEEQNRGHEEQKRANEEGAAGAFAQKVSLLRLRTKLNI